MHDFKTHFKSETPTFTKSSVNYFSSDFPLSIYLSIYLSVPRGSDHRHTVNVNLNDLVCLCVADSLHYNLVDHAMQVSTDGKCQPFQTTTATDPRRPTSCLLSDDSADILIGTKRTQRENLALVVPEDHSDHRVCGHLYTHILRTLVTPPPLQLSFRHEMRQLQNKRETFMYKHNNLL